MNIRVESEPNGDHATPDMIIPSDEDLFGRQNLLNYFIRTPPAARVPSTTGELNTNCVPEGQFFER